MADLRLFSLAALMLILVPAVSAHITMNPNSGAHGGDYFFAEIKIPHGSVDFYTTKLEIEIPDGVLTAKPESLPGWSITTQTGAITPYVSHGREVTTGPKKIIMTVDHPDNGLHNDHLLMIGLQMKMGCSFDGTTNGYNSVWNGKPTLWFPMVQHVAPASSLIANHTLDWIGLPTGPDDSWGGLQPKPTPYIQLDAWPKCQHVEHVGDLDAGIIWGGSVMTQAQAPGNDAMNTAIAMGTLEAQIKVLQTQMETASKGSNLATINSVQYSALNAQVAHITRELNNISNTHDDHLSLYVTSVCISVAALLASFGHIMSSNWDKVKGYFYLNKGVESSSGI